MVKKEGKYLFLTKEEYASILKQMQNNYAYCIKHRRVSQTIFSYDYLLNKHFLYCDIAVLSHMELDMRTYQLLKTCKEVMYSHFYQYKNEYYVIVKVII